MDQHGGIDSDFKKPHDKIFYMMRWNAIERKA